jgi:hypothetical protein
MGGPTYRFGQRLGAIVDPSEKQPFLVLINPRNTRPTQMLDKLSQRHPASRVHM